MGLPLISINHEVNIFFANQFDNVSLIKRLLAILTLDESSLRNYVEAQEALAIKNGTLNSLIAKLDQILNSGSA